MKYRMAVAAALFPVAAWAWPWSTDMVNQPSIKPQEGEMRAFPQRSVPVGGIATEVANRDEAKPLTSPIHSRRSGPGRPVGGVARRSA